MSEGRRGGCPELVLHEHGAYVEGGKEPLVWIDGDRVGSREAIAEAKRLATEDGASVIVHDEKR